MPTVITTGLIRRRIFVPAHFTGERVVDVDKSFHVREVYHSARLIREKKINRQHCSQIFDFRFPIFDLKLLDFLTRRLVDWSNW